MTAWPIVFNFEPSSQGTPAIDIRQGGVGSYTIKAIPDPKYPNTVPVDPITGVRTLPPQPTVTSLNVSNVTNEYKIDTTVWSLGAGYTASVYFNSNDIFPFKQINLLLTDNTTRTFTTKAAVDAFSNNASMPFLVTSCIPVNEQYVYRALSVTATSNSTTTPTLTRTFWIRMESDFTKTQDLLLSLLGRSQSYIDSIAALNPPTKPFTPPTLSSPTKAPASEVVAHSYTSIVNRNEVSEPDFVLDELFRKKDPSSDITLLEEKSGKDIISLIDQQLADVEVNMKEGIINNSIVPLSDIELLLEQDKNIDCCTCDIPDVEKVTQKAWQYIGTVDNYSDKNIIENDKLRIVADYDIDGAYLRVFYKNINTEFKKLLNGVSTSQFFSDGTANGYFRNNVHILLYENNDTLFVYTRNKVHRINLNDLVNVNPTISSSPDILDSVVATVTPASFTNPRTIIKTSTKFFLRNIADSGLYDELYESSDLLTWNKIYTLDTNARNIFVYNDVLYYNDPDINAANTGFADDDLYYSHNTNLELRDNILYRSTNGYEWVVDSHMPIKSVNIKSFIKDGRLYFTSYDYYASEGVLYRYENNGTYTKIPTPMLDGDEYYVFNFDYVGDTYLAYYGHPNSSIKRSYDLNQYTIDVPPTPTSILIIVWRTLLIRNTIYTLYLEDNLLTNLLFSKKAI